MVKRYLLPFGTAALSLAFAISLPLSAYGAGHKQEVTKQQAKSEIQKYLDKPNFEAPGPAVNASKVKGKKLLVVAHDQISDLLVHIAKGVQEAGPVAGLKVSLFDAQGQATKVRQGIQRGINQKVGAILLDGVAADLVPSVLKAANKAHIPVIGMTIGLASEGGAGPGVDVAVDADNNLMGELMAYGAIAHSSGGEVNAVLQTFNNPDSRGVEAGIRKVFKQCRKCKIVGSANVEPSEWPTKIASTTSSQVRSNPKVNFVLPTADTMGIFATTGVRQAGAGNRVKVLSADGSSAGTLGLVKKGQIYIVNVGKSANWIGWQAVDEALRLMTGKKPGNPVVPIRYLDTSNLSDLDIHDQSSIYGDAYKAGFKKLWGISGS